MAKQAKREVKVRCQGSGLADIAELEPMQGNLKLLTEKNYLKLRGLIESQGFSFPVFIWRNGKRLCILDGHQRVATLRKMREEGWVVPKIPIAEVQASTLKEAQEKLLAAASQYGKVDRQGLYEYMQGADIDMSFLKSNIDLPELDLSSFDAEYFGNPSGSSDGDSSGDDDEEGGKVTCDKCGSTFRSKAN